MKKQVVKKNYGRRYIYAMQPLETLHYTPNKAYFKAIQKQNVVCDISLLSFLYFHDESEKTSSQRVSVYGIIDI